MRRYRFAALLLLLALLLTGCVGDLFKTKDYRAYKSFAEAHEPGMGQEEILRQLGEPDSRREAVWSYECYEFSDPANPCRLVITFDDEGKSVEATFSYVPGG
ncbi:MAG: hypothetical protein E7470_01650 [Ruminococcaceae bacterium]|nr:hypothetical protein [Oscillospiraceae bacterium]